MNNCLDKVQVSITMFYCMYCDVLFMFHGPSFVYYAMEICVGYSTNNRDLNV